MIPPPDPAYLPVDLLLAGYAAGRFPMSHADGALYWHDPDPRAIFPLEGMRPNARAQRAFRQAGFTITHDRAFASVIRSCADRADTWIDERIIHSFEALHAAGYAHSVETWTEGELVGGLYGVALGAAFFGESMFSKRPNAGKAAFFASCAHLQQQGFTLFDTQYINDHTRRLGAVELSRKEFRVRLKAAMDGAAKF